MHIHPTREFSRAGLVMAAELRLFLEQGISVCESSEGQVVPSGPALGRLECRGHAPANA